MSKTNKFHSKWDCWKGEKTLLKTRFAKFDLYGTLIHQAPKKSAIQNWWLMDKTNLKSAKALTTIATTTTTLTTIALAKTLIITSTTAWIKRERFILQIFLNHN